MGLRLLVTVGSTSFQALTDHVVTPHALARLRDLGVDTVIVQHGAAPLPAPPENPLLDVQSFAYTADLAHHLDNADMIISHAGAGTISEGLDKGKRMLVVVNDALMNNHQTELASAMAGKGCCVMITAGQLAQYFDKAVERVMNISRDSIRPPEKNETAFAAVLADLINTYDSV